MKNKLIAVGVSLILLAGLFCGVHFYQDKQVQNKSKSFDTYRVKQMNDVVLDGVVKSKEIVKLNDAPLADLRVKNGEHVNRGDLIYKSGYVAPETGTFSINSNDTYSIISDTKYVSANVPEYNKFLTQQGKDVEVWNLDNSKHSDNSKITYVSVEPMDTNNSVSNYEVKTSIDNFDTGTHVKVHVPNNRVYIPEGYVKNNYVNIKKNNSEGWQKQKIKLIRQYDTLYAYKSDVPIDSILRKK